MGTRDSDFHSTTRAVRVWTQDHLHPRAREALMCVKVILAQPVGTVGSVLGAHNTYQFVKMSEFNFHVEDFALIYNICLYTRAVYRHVI